RRQPGLGRGHAAVPATGARVAVPGGGDDAARARPGALAAPGVAPPGIRGNGRDVLAVQLQRPACRDIPADDGPDAMAGPADAALLKATIRRGAWARPEDNSSRAWRWAPPHWRCRRPAGPWPPTRSPCATAARPGWAITPPGWPSRRAT